VQLDQSGRLLLPDRLRATAQLTKEVAIVGSYQRIEIWDVAKYHQYIDQVESQAEAIAERVETNV
jgi:division/cell wall cluster transcriptional repressor MraZ